MENPDERLATSATSATGSLHGARILVVDDEAVNREVLKMQLELEGCEVFLASLGDEALAFLEHQKVDCVLLDLMLPRRNGFDVCRAIRRTHEASTLPVILLTAKNQVSDLVTAFECGANDFLSKPFSRRELLARLRNHLELARTHMAYARFVPNDLLALLGKAHISDVQLGDQVQREMGLLFLDIRGFTRLSEQMSAKATFDFLNAYFDTINPVVIRHNGFIDKYIGDAVMALFPADPADALRAGIDLLAQVRTFNQSNTGRSLPAIRIGVGAHGGKLMLGTIGHADRMEGTVISETVNIASRLEGMSKAFGVGLVASRSLVQALIAGNTTGGHADLDSLWRPLGRVRAKGSSRSLEIAEVFASDDETLRDMKRSSRGALEKALALFEARAFEPARDAFQAISRACPEDGLVSALAREAERLAREGVPPDWDGAVQFQAK
jgi:two-component system sensor histidine kinase ChiS